MKCPYCMEEIKDKALVCRHCGRDFVFVAQLMERLSTLEQRVADVERNSGVLSEGQTPSASPRTSATDQRHGIRRAVAVVGALVVSGVMWYYNYYHGTGYTMYFTTLIPVPFGLWLGLRLPSARFWSLGLTGAVYATLFMVAAAIQWSIAERRIILPDKYNTLPALAMFAGMLTLFTLGGILGRWVARLKRPRTGTSLAHQIAVRIVPTSSSEERIRNVASWVSVVTPILTILATLAAAYLNYLGVVASKR